VRSLEKLRERHGKKMCFQTTLEGSECVRRSDAGWQSVPGTWRSDEERAVTNRSTTLRWCMFPTNGWVDPYETWHTDSSWARKCFRQVKVKVRDNVTNKQLQHGITYKLTIVSHLPMLLLCITWPDLIDLTSYSSSSFLACNSKIA